MPPTAAERRAVQAHAALIDQYNTELAGERDRLLRGRLRVCLADWFGVPLGDRRIEWVEPLPFTAVHGRLHNRHYFRLGGPAGSITTVTGERRLNKGRRTLLRIRRLIDRKLSRFGAAHRPRIEPWDTPARIVGWIDERFRNWNRLPRLMALTPLGQAALDADPGRFPAPSSTGAPVFPEHESRDVYRATLARAHSFARLVPSLLADLQARPDPVVGLREIRAYFAFLAEVVPDPEPEPPQEDEALDLAIDDLIDQLRRRGAANQARLIEFLRPRRSASFEEIAHHVHGNDQTSGDAIRQNIKRTNDALVLRNSRLVFRTGSSRVYKEISPE